MSFIFFSYCSPLFLNCITIGVPLKSNDSLILFSKYLSYEKCTNPLLFTWILNVGIKIFKDSYDSNSTVAKIQLLEDDTVGASKIDIIATGSGTNNK